MAAKKISNVVADATASTVSTTDAVDATVPVKAVKVTKSKKAATAATVAAPTDAVTAAAADGTTATDATDVTTLATPAVAVNPSTTTLDNILKNFASLTQSVKDISLQLKQFQKEHNKMARSQKGKSRSATNASGVKRKPSGFAKPAKLTDELCAFLKLPIGSEEPRMVVTSKLNTYIVENNLQRPENRKFINANKELKDLLNLAEGVELSYFNLQKHMRHLFIPTVPIVAIAADAAATSASASVETIVAPTPVAVA
jgi:chromatin remodeling complex protein RSC6